MSSQPTPFQISIPQSKLDDIQTRIKNYPWDTIKSFNNSNWQHGPPPDQLKEICNYWTTKYDWRAREKRMNSVSHYKVKLDDLDIHFVHEKGSGDNPTPLLLLHGWPNTFHSYTSLIPLLTHPEEHGENASDSFDVIVPSLPGYTFSSINNTALSPRKISSTIHKLMTTVLHYPRYLIHGGDWGSFISDLISISIPNPQTTLLGLSQTMSTMRHHACPRVSGKTSPNASLAERTYAAHEASLTANHEAYAALHCTKPLKLSYGLLDSPVGVAAWILEAFAAWSDFDHRSTPLTSYYNNTPDDLLDEVMLYLVTDSFGTALWIYAADFEAREWTMPEGVRIEVPTAVLKTRDPVFPMPPRELIERSHRVVRYTDVGKGGHFPFYEIPDVVVGELRAFNRELKEGRFG